MKKEFKNFNEFLIWFHNKSWKYDVTKIEVYLVEKNFEVIE